MCEQVDDFTCSESDPELDPETVNPARGTAGHAGRLPKVRAPPRPSVAALGISQRTSVFRCHVGMPQYKRFVYLWGGVYVWSYVWACVAQDRVRQCIYGLGGNLLHPAGNPPLPNCTQ